MIKVIIGWGEWIETPADDWPCEWRSGNYEASINKEELAAVFLRPEKNITDVKVGEQLFHRLDKDGKLQWVEDRVMQTWMDDEPTVDDWDIY
jgi:hypothetical protein